MKTIELKTVAFQGDVMFFRVKAMPEGGSKEKDGIVGHSETGHHHIAEGAEVMAMPDGMTLYMRALGEHIDIVHKRDYDTHETIRVLTKEGDIIGVKRQREYTPEGWRRVED